jgi:nucleoside diphosphate kinase
VKANKKGLFLKKERGWSAKKENIYSCLYRQQQQKILKTQLVHFIVFGMFVEANSARF